MPESGRGSVARLGRRVAALIIDWLLCELIAYAFFGFRPGAEDSSWIPLAVFAVENLVLVGTWGSTVGHRLLGMRVIRRDGHPAGPLPGLIRTVLLCVVVPALIWDRDSRGLHDKAAGTVLIRL
ncbi:MAG TPA: RDD family protein [Segeticoccus sp.]|uniref:RDD family protein n=1 Tax=Segeticoccus sp. TaxID=2706531 RepID=UPI002D80DDCF|nr:RDD family protein [Segeticoccus sp.]HET8601285.1 RDD family protein [Segeticoccus sp.]